MTKFLTPANVELDSCDSHGIWLDSNELEIILRQAPQGGGGGSQEPGLLDGAGRNFVQSAVGGAGFSLVNMFIRRLFG